MDIQISLAFLFSAYLLPVFVSPCVFSHLKSVSQRRARQNSMTMWAETSLVQIPSAPAAVGRSRDVWVTEGQQGGWQESTGADISTLAPRERAGGAAWWAQCEDSPFTGSQQRPPHWRQDSEVTTMKNYTVMLKPTGLCGILSVKLKKKFKRYFIFSLTF